MVSHTDNAEYRRRAGRRGERGHQERHQRNSRFGLGVRPQYGLRRARFLSSDELTQAFLSSEPVWGVSRGPARDPQALQRQEQDLLLRRLPGLSVFNAQQQPTAGADRRNWPVTKPTISNCKSTIPLQTTCVAMAATHAAHSRVPRLRGTRFPPAGYQPNTRGHGRLGEVCLPRGRSLLAIWRRAVFARPTRWIPPRLRRSRMSSMSAEIRPSGQRTPRGSAIASSIARWMNRTDSPVSRTITFSTRATGAAATSISSAPQGLSRRSLHTQPSSTTRPTSLPLRRRISSARWASRATLSAALPPRAEVSAPRSWHQRICECSESVNLTPKATDTWEYRGTYTQIIGSHEIKFGVGFDTANFASPLAQIGEGFGLRKQADPSSVPPPPAMLLLPSCWTFPPQRPQPPQRE